MTHERRVKLLRNGRNQALRIPKEFELPGDEAIIRKVADSLVVVPARPVKRESLLEFLATLEPIDEEFPDIDDPPIEPEDIF